MSSTSSFFAEIAHVSDDKNIDVQPQCHEVDHWFASDGGSGDLDCPLDWYKTVSAYFYVVDAKSYFKSTVPQ